tara:strand:- start:2209 stop:2925 length:717 start_codon:yes stop_codon:yes gene_type:complete
MKGEAGNALFLILIAVALFAALSYAVTSSGRGGSGIDREEAELKLAEVHNYISSIQTGVQRLLLRGCRPEQLDFGNTVWSQGSGNLIAPPDHNPHAPDDHRCDLFHQDGAGLTPLFIPDAGHRAESEHAYLPGHFVPLEAKVMGIGSPEADLLLETTVVSDAICQTHNRRVGLELTTIPIETCTDCGGFNGTFRSNPSDGFGDEVPELAGRESFCINWAPSAWDPNGINYLLTVLVAR